MRTFLSLLPAIACLAMLAVSIPMLLRRGEAGHEQPGQSAEIASLREEVSRLRAELEGARRPVQTAGHSWIAVAR